MSSQHSSSHYLFISGPSRSGTAMLRSAINRSQHVSLAGETHYFDDLRLRYLNRPWPKMNAIEKNECCDYFRVQTVRPYGKGGNPGDSWISREDLLNAAEKLEAEKPQDTGIDSLFLAYCNLIAMKDGAKIGGEKTPRHVLRIADILKLLPEAKVLCMVRDPRAVVASYRDWKYRGGLPVGTDVDYQKSIRADEERSRRSYHIVIATMMWMAAVGAARKSASYYGEDRVRIIRYEDIVADPENTLRSICNWLDIPFDGSLLEIPLHNSSSADFTERAGVSTAPQNRWKNVLSEDEISIIEWVSRRTMKTFGYEFQSQHIPALSIIKAYSTLPIAIVRAARANRDRYDSLPKYVFRRLLAVVEK